MRVKIIMLLLLIGLFLLPGQSIFASPRSDSVQAIPQTTEPAPTPVVDSADRPSGPPLSLTLVLLGFGCLLLLIFGVFILGFVVRSGNYKEMNKNNTDDKL